MADAETKHSEQEKTNNGDEVIVKEKKGEDPASSPKTNGRTFYDMLAGFFQVPFLGLAEEHLWRTRDTNLKERHQCLHEFKKDFPRLYASVLIADLVVLSLLLGIILFVLGLVCYFAMDKLVGQ